MSEREILETLRPWLGAALLTQCDVCARLQADLRSYDGDLAALSQKIANTILAQVRVFTQGTMRVQLDDGRLMRLYADDVDQMADEVLYLLLRRLTHNVSEYQRVREFAMTHETLAGLKALYLDFAAFQTQDELDFIAKTARSNHLRYRWQSWLT